MYSTLNPKEANWDKLYQDYDAAIDWPTVNFYQELLQHYPHAKVILTVRSADSWYESIKNTIHKNALLRETWKDPDRPNHAYYRMVNYALMDGHIYDAKKFQNEELVKKMYLDHIEQVKTNVPADQLLVMELGGDSWQKLCEFLDHKVPNIPYPKTNSTK
ncbi:hypothetical protein HPULCUR_000939 [Helicostylum pulchrum]|uniref:Uncharacterized protein n=1 Tax=Helicostylum pulchrum TaxID=562976 RepID=A0ABP9XN58_9FUNG